MGWSKYPYQFELTHSTEVRSERKIGKRPTGVTKRDENPRGTVGEVTVKQIYQCNICGTSLQSLRSYNRHSDFHKGKFKHTCAYCQKGFMSSTDLKGHMAKHTNVKVHQCEICLKKFAYHTSLNRHMGLAHAAKSF